MVHFLPHWNWLDRKGKTTPVHVFTSGDEAELFLNGNSLGKKKKGDYEYRLRWDDVKYEPGELQAIAYKNGKYWAKEIIKTTEAAAGLEIEADRKIIEADGDDLSFITVKIIDRNGLTVPDANDKITFHIEGPGKIVATDNGDPTDLVAFASKERKALSGMVLAIVRTEKNKKGEIIIHATSNGLKKASLKLLAK